MATSVVMAAAAMALQRRAPSLTARSSSLAIGSMRRGLATVPPLVLALDLDETLVRPKIFGAPEHRRRSLISTDHECTIDIYGGVPCHLSLRPGLGAFFDWVRERRAEGLIEGPWLFAQGVQPYVDAVLSELDPSADLFGSRVLSKEACTPASNPGYVMKDLEKVPCSAVEGVPPVHRVILVDNNAMSALLHPENVLLVRDWRADRVEDDELARVTTVLDALLEAEQGAAGEPGAGNYAARLSAMTPRHDSFKRHLPVLRSLMDSGLGEGETLHSRLLRSWKTAAVLKQHLLGLPAGAN